MTKHILLVDDDALMRRSLAFNLEQAGYRASTAADAENALRLARRDAPDLILLDIGLPGMDGLDALRNFRQEANTPIIFVTARRRELDQALGLELGADDYVTKPFDVNVLLARIKAVLRRSERGEASAPAANRIEVGDLVIESAAHVVTLAGKKLELAPREFSLLHALALSAGRRRIGGRSAGTGLGRRICRRASGRLCPHPLAARKDREPSPNTRSVSSRCAAWATSWYRSRPAQRSEHDAYPPWPPHPEPHPAPAVGDSFAWLRP